MNDGHFWLFEIVSAPCIANVIVAIKALLLTVIHRKWRDFPVEIRILFCPAICLRISLWVYRGLTFRCRRAN